MTTFSPVARGRGFTDPFDIFVNENGEYAYLQILTPHRRVTSDGTIQSVSQSLPRFREGAERGTVYYAMYTPFMVMDEQVLFDTRLAIDEEALTIEGPVYEGPYLLGVNGPAILFEPEVNEEAAEEEEPEIA